MDENFYKLYTDGSCLGNPGAGGTGVYLTFPDEFGIEPLSDYRGYHNTTNNRMELRASIDGLKLVRTQIKLNGYRLLCWYTDSMYIADYLIMVDKWRGNDWIKRDGEPVLNIDLWRELNSLSRDLQILPTWISRDYNKEADTLARQGAKNSTHTDFGYNPGKVGKSISGSSSSAPTLYDKNQHTLIRVYRGDGQISKTDSRCKIRFEIMDEENNGIFTKYYAYAEQKIYHRLNRTHEYVVNIIDGNIIEIIEEL